MGVCASTEGSSEEGIAEPEKDLFSDPLSKEPLKDEVLGQKPDSSIGTPEHGYIFSLSKCVVLQALRHLVLSRSVTFFFFNLSDSECPILGHTHFKRLTSELSKSLGVVLYRRKGHG